MDRWLFSGKVLLTSFVFGHSAHLKVGFSSIFSFQLATCIVQVHIPHPQPNDIQ